MFDLGSNIEFASETEEEDSGASDKSISVTDKKDRALPLSSKFRDRNPPMFEQKVEQMYKDDESSDEDDGEKKSATKNLVDGDSNDENEDDDDNDATSVKSEIEPPESEAEDSNMTTNKKGLSTSTLSRNN